MPTDDDGVAAAMAATSWASSDPVRDRVCKMRSESASRVTASREDSNAIPSNFSCSSDHKQTITNQPSGPGSLKVQSIPNAPWSRCCNTKTSLRSRSISARRARSSAVGRDGATAAPAGSGGGMLDRAERMRVITSWTSVRDAGSLLPRAASSDAVTSPSSCASAVAARRRRPSFSVDNCPHEPINRLREESATMITTNARGRFGPASDWQSALDRSQRAARRPPDHVAGPPTACEALQ